MSDRLSELAEQLKRRASEAVRAIAFDIQLDAQLNAPVDTGALKNSIYTVTSEGSDYVDRTGDAVVANPEIEPLPEVTAEEAGVDELTAIVAVGAEYGLYVEMGTSRTPAQPYLGPAAEGQREAFTEAMKRVLG